ncbi:ATP-binding cassette domain-containing protein [bacterium]|nr:ATP-binding cassette domain-containing protein [bacterium]
MNEREIIVELRGLGRKKRRSLKDEYEWILRDVNLKVPSGDRLAIIGPSGSGKTTLLRMMADLEPYNEGEIFFNGKNLIEIEPTEYRKNIGFVQQAPSLFEGSVADNIRYGPALAGENITDDKVEHLLDLVGLASSIISSKSDSLSIGQIQRVAIARALSTGPNILMMDEPTSALDIKTAKKIANLVKRLAIELDLTVVMILHDLALVRGFALDVAFIANGTLIEVSEAKDFFINPPPEFIEQIGMLKSGDDCHE